MHKRFAVGFIFGWLKLSIFQTRFSKEDHCEKWRKKNLAVTIEIHLFCLLLANKAGILKLEPCLPICVSYICNPIVVPRVYCFALFSIFRMWALGSYSQHQKPVICLLLSLWQYGLWSFQTGSTKLERYLPKNQYTQRKFLNFENWTNISSQKSEF